MRHFTILFSILVLAFGTISSQSCLPEGITFTTQGAIDSFSMNYPGCTVIEGDVKISGEDITHLSGLIVLTSIGGTITVRDNTHLANLTGLNNLTHIGGAVWIHSNDTLTSLNGLDNVVAIDGFLNIYNNNLLIDLSGLGNVKSVGSNITIWYNDRLTSLSGMSNLDSLEFALWIENNASLTSLSGINNLTSIGSIVILDNDALTSLSGLGSITYIEGDLNIRGNSALTSLVGLDHVPSIGGWVKITDNDALVSLKDLDKISSIGGGLVITENDSLTSLLEIGNIDISSINTLDISNNIALFECEAVSICEYLTSNTGTVVIQNNAIGCNSQEEVDAACLAVSVDDIDAEIVSVYPNPAHDILHIAFKDVNGVDKVTVYDLNGQLVLYEIKPHPPIDISALQPGLYILEVATKRGNYFTKLIIQ
jgi:hypothetical protein